MFHNIRFMPSTLIPRFENAVAKGDFSCWSYANRNVRVSAFPAHEILSHGHPRFDLASLTKPLFMANLVFSKLASLLRKAPIPLNPHGKWAVPLADFVNRHSHLTILDLINHRSGMRPWAWFGQGLFAPGGLGAFLEDHLLRHVVTLNDGNAGAVYSDLNYYLLAKIYENQVLNLNWNTEIANLNRTNKTNFYHASIEPPPFSVPFYPFQYAASRGDLFGEVHDTNANILAAHQIVSGHAGLFGTIQDVQHMFVGHVANILSFSASDNQSSKHRTDKVDRFYFGLDTPMGSQSSAGSGDVDKFLGHLGYTGTSAWYNRTSQQHCILLTNRTACDVTQDMQGARQTSQRMVSVTSDSQQTFYKIQGDKMIECEFESTDSLVTKTFHCWHSSVLRVPPDISEIRRSAAVDTWSLEV